MKSNNFKYLLKEGFRNVWANRLMSLASVGVLTACLLLVGFTVLMTQNIDSMIGYIEQQNEVVVFLKDDATQEQVQEMQKGLEEAAHVQGVNYISKEQALADYTASLNDETLVEGIGEDMFLPASFRVSIDDLNYLDQVESAAKQYAIYDSSSAPDSAAETIVNLKDTFTMIGAAVVLALIIVSLVVISNTIRATVFARRMEIGVMKQVGATNSFIRLPFIVEGIVLGIISSIVSFFLIWVSYAGITTFLKQETSTFLQSMYQNIIPFDQVWWILAICFLVSGIFAGTLGSVMSLRKHLKV